MEQLLHSRNMPLRFVRLIVGLFLYGVAISLMIRANIGASPWDVFSQGTSRTINLSFGVCTTIISIAVLLLWIPLRQMPRIGTLFNTLLVGLFADVGLSVVPPMTIWAAQLALFAAGLLLLAFSTALYIGADLGPGPRDGLMTGLVRVSGKPVWMVRTGIELTVVILGFSLGGLVGAGTAIFALFVGPSTQLMLTWLQVDLGRKNPTPAKTNQRLGTLKS